MTPFLKLKKVKDYKDYANWCIRLLKIGGTSVGIEKSFKGVRFQHTNLRKKMKPETLKKLVYCYWNIMVLRKIDPNKYRDILDSFVMLFSFFLFFCCFFYFTFKLTKTH